MRGVLVGWLARYVWAGFVESPLGNMDGCTMATRNALRDRSELKSYRLDLELQSNISSER